MEVALLGAGSAWLGWSLCQMNPMPFRWTCKTGGVTMDRSMVKLHMPSVRKQFSQSWLSLFTLLSPEVQRKVQHLLTFISWPRNPWAWQPLKNAEVLLDGICVVQGMIKNVNKEELRNTKNKQETVAILPEECRPRYRLTFNLNVREFPGRFDVLTSGIIVWKASAGWGTDWLSLTGISFTV